MSDIVYCRLCVRPKPSIKVIFDLKRNKSKCKKIIGMLSILSVYIDLSEPSPLPKTVCNNCYKTLLRCCTFLQDISKAQSVLNNLFSEKIKLSPEHHDINEAEIKVEVDTDTEYEGDNTFIVETNELKVIKEKHLQESSTNKIIVGDINKHSDDLDTKVVEELVNVPKYESWNSYEWVCKHCDEELKSLSELRAHSKGVHGKCYGFTCVDCTSEHDNFDAFVKHVCLHWDNLRNFCPYCNKKTSETHIAQHLEPLYTRCNTCGEIFASELLYLNHTQQYNNITKLKEKNSRVKRKKIAVDTEQVDNIDSNVKKIYNTRKRKACEPKTSTIKEIITPKGCSSKKKQTDKYNNVLEYKLVEEIESLPKYESWNSYEWVCKHCDEELESLSELRTHSKDVHRNCYGFTCVDCTSEHDNFDAFVKHVCLHWDNLRNYCPYCNQKVDEQTSDTHVAQHSKSPQSRCLTCGEIFQSEQLFLNHKEQYNGATEPEDKLHRVGSRKVTVEDLTCQICRKVFKSRNTVREHAKQHDANRKREHTCEICGKAFFCKTSLRGHIQLHNTVKPYVCKICNSSFMFMCMLRSHVDSHYGRKPFTCEECGRSFRLRKQLNQHKMIHTGEMPYKCEVCDHRTRYKGHMKNHMLQHSGAKPYSCEVCGKVFTNWANYNKHMIRKHKMDKAKTKRTPDGIFPVDPETGKVVRIEDPVATEEWKNKIMVPLRKNKKKTE